MVLGVLCFQSTQEGYAEELSMGGVGQVSCARYQNRFSAGFCQSWERGQPKGLNSDLRVSAGKVAGLLCRLYISVGVGDVVLTHFPIPNHTGDLKGRMDLKLGLMLILMSDPCDIQSQVAMTAWHECHPGFSSKVIAFWLSKNHASPYWVLRSDKKKELSCSCFQE